MLTFAELNLPSIFGWSKQSRILRVSPVNGWRRSTLFKMTAANNLKFVWESITSSKKKKRAKVRNRLWSTVKSTSTILFTSIFMCNHLITFNFTNLKLLIHRILCRSKEGKRCDEHPLIVGLRVQSGAKHSLIVFFKLIIQYFSYL